jgi:predicted nucleic acid-binding protein
MAPVKSWLAKIVPESVVVDASALVDLLLGTANAAAVRERLSGAVWHAPAHLDAEVLSALGRLNRAGIVPAQAVDERLALFVDLPLQRQPLSALVTGAWARRSDLRLVDALYVELASQLEAPLITTDRKLARAVPFAQAVGD